MSEPAQTRRGFAGETASVHELLLRLDLATEVLEGLDELGLETRARSRSSSLRLERQIADSG